MEFEGQRGDAVTPWSVGKYAKRSASCITTEQTDMLVVDSEFSQQLYQPGFGKSQMT